jgi:amino acid adenylation domain-containing protein/non-ribosomal peptide synthase protein (TIGR01720 family)
MMPEELAAWFRKYKITRSFVPTKFAEIFVGEQFNELSLKTLFTGGDRLSFVHANTKYSLINAYGPTETTVIATACDVTGWDNAKGVPPIGKPLPNIKIYILDRYLKPVPLGVTGQIYIGGAGVGSGYMNDPEKTLKSFISNPFMDGYDRLYATGDLARWLPDGNVDFVGRSDFQVEIRGYRVELGEIEAVLSSLQGIKECVVIDKKDNEGSIRLVGFYVSELLLNEDEIKEYLGKYLPSYMIPSRLVYLEAFPLTPNGKLDRTVLSSMIDLTTDTLIEFVEPSSQTEKELAEFWKHSLGTDRICVNDNFFDIGGNSLRATRIVSWAREKYGIELPLKVVFEKQTLGLLASEIDSLKSSGLKTKLPAIEKVEPADYYEVSHAQKRLWYIDKIVPDSPFYNIPGAVLIDNIPIDQELLKRAFNAVVERHESLRTTIVTIKDKPFQKVSDHMDLGIEIIDYSDMTDNEHRLKELIEKEKNRPFNIEKGPLFRISLIKLSELANVLILNMHHIISDGWSMGILVREALANYLAFAEGKTSPAEDLRIQYKDYASWQNMVLESQEIKEQEAFWVEKLSGEIPVLDLPTDRARPAVQTQNGAVRRINLNLETSAMLRESAKALGVTPFMLTLSMFYSLLNRLTGQDDIIVGSPVANRNNAQIEPLIGFFVNMLPLRADLSGNPTFEELLAIVKQTCVNSYAHQDYPFDKLVEAVNPPRNLSRTPIFDVVFDYHEISANPIAKANVGGIRLKDITGDDSTSKFDLLVTGYESDDGISFTFGYNTDLFNGHTIEHFIHYFLNLVEDAISNPQKKISELKLIDENETRRILHSFNDTASDFPKEKPAHVLFEEIAELYPDKDALVFGNSRMSYKELNERSNRLARHLRANGVGKGTCVAVMVNRSFDMLSAVIGILKAGGSYVPIEAEYPADRIHYMLNDINAPVAIAHESLIESLSGYEGHIVCLESFWEESKSEDASNLDNVNTSDDLAYIIYTSGSTGVPKGVMVPHLGITRLVKNTNYAEITCNDRFLQVATIAFDAATMEFWGPLLNGGTLFLVSGEDSVNPDKLAELIIMHEITILFLTTVMFNQLVDCSPESFGKLKSLLTGGEMQSMVHMRKSFKHVGNGVLTHVYGPTENTTYSTYYKIKSIPDNITGIPIGYPIANSTAYILDKHLNPVPVFVPGEIYVGGLGLAKGYLKDPEKTAGVFISNPMKGVSEDILYKTGDIGKWLPDGAIEILGRMDQQVKIRGHRIELGEIEATIRKHEFVRDTVVVVKDMGSGSKMLLAYYASDTEIPTDVFRAFMRETLPDYMVPNIFIRLDVLPLKKSGKVDKAALPEPKGLRPEMATECVEPRNEIEEIIAQAWQEVLGIDKIGVYDNFFDLGGDSIISLQVVSRLNRRGFSLQPRDILQHQTIAELSSVVTFMRGVEAEQGPVTGISSLTPIQHWFFSQKLQNENHFNQALLFSSQSRVDDKALKNAFQAVIDHHDALRSRFVNNAQEFKPIGEEVAFISKVFENDDLMVGEILKLQASLNIKDGPIFAAGLLHAKSEDYLVVACHHLVVDGVSWRILMEDLMTGYFQSISGGNIELPEKSTSFKEWANKLTDYALKPEVIAEEIWWRDMLSEEVPPVPVELDLGPNNIASVFAVTIELNEKETSRLLKEVNHAYNTNTVDILASVLSESISLWTGSEKTAFVLEGHGREDVIENVDISRTVGWFTTMYPVVLNSSPDIKERIKKTKETLHRIPHKGFNYGILRYLNSVVLPFTTDISFNYLGQVSNPSFDGFKLATADVSGIMDISNMRANLIDIVAMVTNGKLRVNFIYSKNKHTMFTINSLAASFRDRLLETIAHCMDPSNFDITPSDFELIDLGQEELDKLISFE